jgi:hypothetical protein
VVLVGGEPGAGKSRLVREFASDASAAGALVLYGACDAVVRMPYEPFVEALDQLARSIEPEELRAAAGTTAGELTRLLPDLTARIGELPLPPAADPDTGRHRLHTAVTDVLRGIGRRRPVLLIVEDAHWADAPTLLLLRHLARTAGDARVLLLATFRDTPAELPPELAEALADLRRAEDVVRLRLDGLSDAEVGDFVRIAADGTVGSPALTRTMSELTGGNAFLICELWRDLLETGAVRLDGGMIAFTRPPAEVGTPQSVREVVSQRLARLEPRTSDVLELMATAGPEFELAIVRQAAGLGEPELIAVLDDAVRSGIVEELPGGRLAYRFSHELVRRALYDRLSTLRRAELHLRVGEALESAPGRSGRVLADLAHHFASAAAHGPSSTTCSPRARRPPRSPSTRPRPGCAPRSRSASTILPRAPRRSSSSAPPAIAPAARSTRSPRSPRPRRSPASWATASCWPGRRSATRTPVGVRASTRARPSAWRRPPRHWASAIRRCAYACSAAWRGRSATAASTSAPRSCAPTRSRWRAAWTTGRAWRRRWCAPTGRAGPARWTRSS